MVSVGLVIVVYCVVWLWDCVELLVWRKVIFGIVMVNCYIVYLDVKDENLFFCVVFWFGFYVVRGDFDN